MDALKLTFVNGETVSFPFGQDSTLTIDTPDGVNGIKRGSWGEIADVAYVTDAGDEVAETVIPDTQTAPEPAADVPAEDPSLLQKVEDKLGLGHDAAVADTQAAVEVAATGAADDPTAHLTAALADVDVAIAAFPDSAELVDLKSQLEAIQADESAHTGA
jgi:hypothetical protein